MMRVCIATTSFPRWKNDHRGTFIWEAAQALARSNCKITLIAMHNPGAKPYERWGEIEIRRPQYFWPEQGEILQRDTGGLPIVWQKNHWVPILALFFLIRHTIEIAKQARNCDIIHANWTLSAIAAILGHFYHRRPVVATVHGSDIVQATRNPIIKLLTRYTLQKCQKVIAVSQALAQQVISLQIAPHKVIVIPDGVDTDFFSPQLNRDKLILYVGSLIEIKGLKYLLEAIPSILKQLSGYKLRIIGDGPLRHYLEQVTTDNNLDKQIIFMGPQPPKQVQRWMQYSKLLVLPSLEEGLGVVLLEALASGTPIVGTRVGGIPDVITPDVGQLANPYDSYDLARAIGLVLSDESRWEVMSQSARHRAISNYSWPIIASKIVRIYNEVLGQFPPSGKN